MKRIEEIKGVVMVSRKVYWYEYLFLSVIFFVMVFLPRKETDDIWKRVLEKIKGV